MNEPKKLENYRCRAFVSDDEQAVKALVSLLDATLEETQSKEYWDWKYKSNPNFEASFIAVAETNGKIIGCNHWIPINLRLTDTLNVNAIFAADLIVDPAYRGSGVGTNLLRFLRSSTGDVIKKKEIVASMMITGDLRLNKNFFNSSFDYIPIQNNVITYYKLLNIKTIQEKIDSFKKSKQVNMASNHKMRVLFNIKGLPKFLININKNNIELSETDFSQANVVLTADLNALEIVKNNHSLLNLLRIILLRKIKISGVPIGIIRLYQNRFLLQAVFVSKKI